MNFKHAILFLLCLFATQHISAQDFTVNKTNDNKVEITYNAKRKLKKVELYVSTDGGQDYQGPLTIKGDRYDIPKGKNKKIIWDPSVDNPRGYDGYFRFRLDKFQEEDPNYRKGFFLMLNPGFIVGDDTLGGFGGTFGYMFKRFGLSLSLGSYFGGEDGYSYPYTLYYSWGPSTYTRYQDGFSPNFYFQFGALYRIVPKFSLKVGIGMLREHSTLYAHGNPIGSLGFMLQFNHILLSTDGVFAGDTAYGFCGGLNFGVGYAF